MFRLIFAHEVFHHVIFQKFDVFHGVAGDETVLADHDRKHHVFVFGDAVCLNHVVVGFLIVLGKNLNPSGVSRAHGVGMIAVDVDRAGEGAVYKGQTDREPVGGSHI